MDVCKDGERDPWLREALRLLQLASGTDDMKLIVSAEIKMRRLQLLVNREMRSGLTEEGGDAPPGRNYDAINELLLRGMAVCTVALKTLPSGEPLPARTPEATPAASAAGSRAASRGPSAGSLTATPARLALRDAAAAGGDDGASESKGDAAGMPESKTSDTPALSAGGAPTEAAEGASASETTEGAPALPSSEGGVPAGKEDSPPTEAAQGE